jgi:hypothetical protein
MSVPLYRPDSRTLQPGRRLAQRPGGQPAPTGYYPDLTGERSRDYVSDHQVLPYGNRPARQELGDRSELVDQHPFVQVDQMWTPPPDGPRRDGTHDPATDGPPLPTVRLLQLFLQRARGTDQTRFLDVPGRRFPSNGSQDGSTWVYFQDARLSMMPLNADGTAPDSLRSLPPSPAHGWTVRPVVNASEAELRKTAGLRQQQRPHQDRLAPATAAGQTYSQRTTQVGEGLQRAANIGSRRPRG